MDEIKGSLGCVFLRFDFCFTFNEVADFFVAVFGMNDVVASLTHCFLVGRSDDVFVLSSEDLVRCGTERSCGCRKVYPQDEHTTQS